MTSGRFSVLPLGAIQVLRDQRQRKELRGIDELAQSIAARGLIHPIVVTAEGVLVAGERRYTAMRKLGWTETPVQYVDDLSAYELACIEFEENVKRVDLTWQEEVLALAAFHELKAGHEPNWTQERTADEVGLGAAHVGKMLAVAKEMTNERVATADKLSSAINLVARSTERRKANALASIQFPTAEEPDDEPVPIPLLCASFHDWQPTYTGPKFNLIHCDFPYGINVADSPRQNAALGDHYEDGPDVYWSLLSRLGAAMHNVVADSANLIFWFSMDYYADTLAELNRMGWTVNPFPLVWHKSDNSGIAPDTQRWPRRTYETAFVGSRGDRKLTQVGPKANSFAHPGNRAEAIHISQKPLPVLQHFMSMYCDEYSLVLDPTCGSGSAVKTALGLGALQALGLEQSQDFYDIAVANWNE